LSVYRDKEQEGVEVRSLSRQSRKREEKKRRGKGGKKRVRKPIKKGNAPLPFQGHLCTLAASIVVAKKYNIRQV